MQQTVDHGTIPPLPATVSFMLSEWGEKKPSQFKLQKNEAGLIFWSALPEDLDWDTRVEGVALSLDAIKRCLANMRVALD